MKFKDGLKTFFVGILWIMVLSVIFYFVGFYKLSEKTDKIFTAALEDFEKGDYQNSYYLFSKVSFLSPLKPVAIYHRGLCAQKLEDSTSAIKQYTFLYNNYPKNKLSLRAKYLAAQEMTKTEPNKAKKIFNNIIKKAPQSDYAIAAEYYLGEIILNKYSDKEGNLSPNFPNSKKLEAENHFRHYLKKAPAGRLAYNVVNSWLKLGGNISQDDYLLMAKTAYSFADYDKVDELLEKTNISESWILYAKNNFAKNNIEKAKQYTKTGLSEYSQYIDKKELEDVISLYVNSSQSKIAAINELLNISSKSGMDYIMNLQCENVTSANVEGCYNNLYLYNTIGDYAPKALSKIFISKVKLHDYNSAKKVGNDYLNKFPNSEFEPMVRFWLGKIAESYSLNQEAQNYYNSIIMKTPDNYYAFRAYLRLNRLQGPLIISEIKPQPVEYPYHYADKRLIENLIKLQDYEILDIICEGDDFIKSWILYHKGDYAHSTILARNAIEKMKNKPDKYDLRWRLVYPLNYYDTIKHYAEKARNNIPLILSIIREESYFDPKAQSVVGASGLMQIMPATANEIAKRYELDEFYNLFDADTNIMLGNYYYSELRSLLSGFDVSAIAAYNGGIGNVQQWKTSLYYNDTDEFIEQIPYPETQDYVKKVFRSYWNYIRIYTAE